MPTQQLEAVICPWCRTEFEIDPAEAAFLYWCPSADCGQRLSLAALRHPNFEDNAIELSHEQCVASCNNLHRHSVAYTYKREGVERGASGTLVELEGRMFIATTGHSIPLKASRITFVPKKDPDEVERFPSILRIAKIDEGGVDVGLIEVEPDAPRLLGIEAIGIDRIADLESGRHAVGGFLIGYPAAKQQPHMPKQGILGFEGLAITCEPLEPISWHRIPIGEDAVEHSPSKHVMIHYSLTEPLFNHSDNPNKDDHAPDPHGMSGGGLWQFAQSMEGRVWSPSMLCLFAIQASWPQLADHLKATQIIYWLRLVADIYPDLRDRLCDQFPRLSKLPSKDRPS